MGLRNGQRRRNRIAVRFGLEGAEKLGFTRDVSERGLFVKSHNVFRTGTRMQVRVRVADRPVDMWARVVWSKAVPRSIAHAEDSGMGLELENPPAEWALWCRRLPESRADVAPPRSRTDPGSDTRTREAARPSAERFSR
jgi:hypothetical protein